MVSKQVIIQEYVRVQLVCGHKVTQSGPKVGLGPAVGAVQTALSKRRIVVPVIQRHQQIKLRIFQREFFIHVQLHVGSAELA